MQLGSGLEAIAFQRTRPVFTLLTAEIQSLMDKLAAAGETKITDAILKESKIGMILSAASGFDNITLVADQYAPINAYTNVISISKMHVFHDSWRRATMGSADAYTLYRHASNALVGQIDLVSGKVSGDFSKIPLTIGLGNQFLNPKYGFTAGEIAAVLLHELGHDFTYCYTLHYTCTTNMVLMMAAQAVVAATDTKQKHAIMTDVQNTLGIKIENMADLTDYDKYEDYYITMLGAYRKTIYDALGSPSYNTNMSEQMADMFAARHGAGAALVTGLNRMNKLFAPNGWQRSVYRAQTVLAFVAFAPVMIPLFLTGVFINDFIAGSYDLDKDRFIRIRNEAIASLKDTSLTADEKKTIMAEIDTINAIIKTTDNDWLVAGKIAMLIRSSQRAQARQKSLLQDLEALTNNPLYVAAAKYSV